MAGRFRALPRRARARFHLTLQYRAAALAGFGHPVLVGRHEGHGPGGVLPTASGASADEPAPGGRLHLARPGLPGDAAVVRRSGRASRHGPVGRCRLRAAEAGRHLSHTGTRAPWPGRSRPGRSLGRMPMRLDRGRRPARRRAGRWSLRPPSSHDGGFLFVISIARRCSLSTAMVQMITGVVVATLSDRGAERHRPGAHEPAFRRHRAAAPVSRCLARRALLQPFAGLVDIPYRIYLGQLTGRGRRPGIALQLGWTADPRAAGRAFLGRSLARLQIAGRVAATDAQLYGRYVAVSLRGQMQYPGAVRDAGDGPVRQHRRSASSAIWALFARFGHVAGLGPGPGRAVLRRHT